jgi:hypothetical protein
MGVGVPTNSKIKSFESITKFGFERIKTLWKYFAGDVAQTKIFL